MLALTIAKAEHHLRFLTERATRPPTRTSRLCGPRGACGCRQGWRALSNQPLALGFTPLNDLGTTQSPVSNRTALLHCREADQKRPWPTFPVISLVGQDRRGQVGWPARLPLPTGNSSNAASPRRR